MNHQAFVIKHQQRSTLTIRLLTTELSQIKEHIQNIKAQGPLFFHGALIVLNLEHLKQLPDKFLDGLMNLFHNQQLFIAGITKDPHGHHNLANTYHIPTITEQETTKKTPTQTKIIQRPIRSGQQIIAESDLVIVGSVSAGAELLATGNIHVYGTLRGKALAGIDGNHSAAIFCQSLEAELIAIAGTHHLTADIPAQYLGRGRIMVTKQVNGLSYSDEKNSLNQGTNIISIDK